MSTREDQIRLFREENGIPDPPHRGLFRRLGEAVTGADPGESLLGQMRQNRDRVFRRDVESEAPTVLPAVAATPPPDPPGAGSTRRNAQGALVYDSANRTRDGKVPTHRVGAIRDRLLPGETVEDFERRVVRDAPTQAGSAVSSLDTLEPGTREGVERMLAAAAAEGVRLTVNETLRPQDRQDALFRIGRDGRGGSPVTWTLTSNHADGRAVDFGGDLDWLQRNAGRFGLDTLGSFDEPHVQAPERRVSAQPAVNDDILAFRRENGILADEASTEPDPPRRGFFRRAAERVTGADPGESLLAQMRENRAGAAGGGRQVLRGLADSGYATLEGVGALGNRITGTEHVDLEALRRSRDEMREFYGEPESTGQAVSQGAGRVVGDLAQFMAPGVAAGRAGLIPKVTQAGARGYVARTGVNVGVTAPVTVAQAAGSPENSATGALAELTGSETMGRLSSTMGGRIAGDLALDAGLSGVVEGAAAGLRAFRGINTAGAGAMPGTHRAAPAAHRDDVVARGRDIGRQARAAVEEQARAPVYGYGNVDVPPDDAALRGVAGPEPQVPFAPKPNDLPGAPGVTPGLDPADFARPATPMVQPDDPRFAAMGASPPREQPLDLPGGVPREVEPFDWMRPAEPEPAGPRLVEDPYDWMRPRDEVVPEEMGGMYVPPGTFYGSNQRIAGEGVEGAPRIRMPVPEDLPPEALEALEAYRRATGGFASREATTALAGGGVGAAAGAALDDDSPLRGAAIGGALGAGAGAGLARAGRAAPTSPATYLSDPAVQSVLGTVSRRGGPPPILQRLAAGVGDTPNKFRRAYTRVLDQAYPLRQFGRDVGGSERLSNEVSRYGGWRGAATSRLETSFRGVVRAASGHEDGVLALAKAERALELARNGMPEKGVDLAEAQRVVDVLGAVPEVRAATDALQGYYRELLEHRLANGNITQDAYDALVAKGEFYTPFVRDFGEETAAKQASGGGGRLLQRVPGLRKMAAGKAESATVDPFEQAILDTFATERAVGKQRVTNIVSEIVEADPIAAAAFVREIPNASAAKGERVVQANVNGERKFYEVRDEEMFQAWAGMDAQSENLFVSLARPFKETLRVTVTSLPGFSLANGIRDNVMSAIQYQLPVARMAASTGAGAVGGAALDEEDRGRGALRGAALGLGASGLVPQLARTLTAMRSVVKEDAVYREWMEQGGAGFGWYANDPKGTRKILATLRSEGVKPSDILLPTKWWEALQYINQVVEQAPRVARFAHLRRGGADVTEAVARSRDLSLDFYVQGRAMKGWNAVTAFQNAQLQGWDKLVRMLKNPKTWGVGAATVTAPTIALWSVNKDNPEYWERPQWERNMFWLLPKEGGGFWRVPKPFEVGFIFASIPERLLDYAHQKDPESLNFTLRDMLSTTYEGAMGLPTVIEPLLENVVNYDMFRNRPVVRPGLARLPNELQYDERTSYPALAIGQATGASPMKVENVIEGYAGSIGREASKGISALARRTGLDDRPAHSGGAAPLVGRFMTRADQTSDQEITVRRRFQRAEKAYNGIDALIDRGDKEALEQYVERHRDQLAEYYRLLPLSEALDEVSRVRGMIQSDPEMSAAEKRERLAQISTRMASTISGYMEQAQEAAP